MATSSLPHVFCSLLALLLVSAAVSAAARIPPGKLSSNQSAAALLSHDRRLLQDDPPNDWSQPSSGPVDVNWVYSVLDNYVTVDLARIYLRMLFHDAGAHDKSSGDGGANGSLKYELDR
jgi:hypothetical protein